MEEIRLYPFEDMLDQHIGKIGTPRRDAFERNVDEAVEAYEIGEAVKRTRKMHNMTQSQLGERVGVKAAQISKIENGKSLAMPTVMRVFRAMGAKSITLNLEKPSVVALH